MRLFRRVLNGLFFLAGIAAGIIAAISLFFARYLISPPRQRLWATPADLGLVYESVHFPAKDGVRLSGWFVPAGEDSKGKGATIVLIHGWTWNRLGDAAEDFMANMTGSSAIDLLRLAYALHQEGFHVLMFDLRNHGESASALPVTFGRAETRDLLGALTYLNGRSDVAPDRIGAIGFSAGGNTLLYTMGQTDQIKAGVAVQPASISVFAPRFTQDLLGALGSIVSPIVEQLYLLAGGHTFEEIRPITAVSSSKAPILYIQGNGDQWGSVADVENMSAATPNGKGTIIADTTHRYGGYQYPIDNPKILAAFFEQNFSTE